MCEDGKDVASGSGKTVPVTIDDSAEDDFSATDSPKSITKTCTAAAQWKLTITVVAKSSIAPRKAIRVQLDRIGITTGRRKSPSKDRHKEVHYGEEIPPFTGHEKERFKVHVVMDQEDWFYWTSETKDVLLRNGDDKAITIEIRPTLVLVAMAGIMAPIEGITPAPLWEGDDDCAETYHLTKTVTASDIRGIIGTDKLGGGTIHASAVVAKAKKLEALLDFQVQPFFSVIDLNLSHQMSFFLSCLAFHKFGRHGKKLIINFDNHQDYSGSDPVWYDKWGAGFFQHAETLSDLFTPERVVYTILGETKMEVSKPAVRGSVKQLYYSNRTRAGAEADSSHPLGTVEFRTDPTPFVNGRRTTASWILRHDGRELASGVQDADIEELCIEKILERPASALKDLTDHLFKVRTGPHVTTGLREKNRPLVTKLNETGAPTIDGRRKPDYWILKHDGFELASPIEDVDIQELCDKGVLARPASAFKDLKDYLFELQPGPHDRTGLREKNGPLVTRLNEIDAAIIDLTTCAGDAMLKSEYITDLSDTDVYITVDRDVSQKSFTYWGDGYLTSAQMRSAVERCLGFLKSKGANLVGFDIAGLPDSAGKSAVLGIKRGNVGAHKAEICQQAKDDIEFFLSKVMAYGPID